MNFQHYDLRVTLKTLRLPNKVTKGGVLMLKNYIQSISKGFQKVTINFCFHNLWIIEQLDFVVFVIWNMSWHSFPTIGYFIYLLAQHNTLQPQWINNDMSNKQKNLNAHFPVYIH